MADLQIFNLAELGCGKNGCSGRAKQQMWRLGWLTFLNLSAFLKQKSRSNAALVDLAALIGDGESDRLMAVWKFSVIPAYQMLERLLYMLVLCIFFVFLNVGELVCEGVWHST